MLTPTQSFPQNPVAIVTQPKPSLTSVAPKGFFGTSHIRITTIIATILAGAAYYLSNRSSTLNNTVALTHPFADQQPPICLPVTALSTLVNTNADPLYMPAKLFPQPTTPVDFATIAQDVARYTSVSRVIAYAIDFTPCEIEAKPTPTTNYTSLAATNSPSSDSSFNASNNKC